MTDDRLYELLAVISVLLAIFSLYLFKKSNKIERSFHYYLVVKAFFEVIALVLSSYGNNLIGLHLFTVVQFVVITIFFRNSFKFFNAAFKYFLILWIGLCLILINSSFIQPIDTFNSYTRFLVELYMIISCIYLFILLIQNSEYDRSYMLGSVAFISAIFLEASGSLIFYMYSNIIIKMDPQYYYVLFRIRMVLHFIVYALIAYGLFQIYKKGKFALK